MKKAFLMILILLTAYTAFAEPKLSWKGSDNATSYGVYLTRDNWTTTLNSDLGNVLEYSLEVLEADLNLQKGVEYTFVVRARNSAGESENSNSVTYTIPGAFVPPPDNVETASGTIPTETIISRVDDMLVFQASENADNYTIYCSRDDWITSLNKTVNVTEYSLTALQADLNLLKGATYEIVVRASNSTGESGNSNGVPFTIPGGFVPPPDVIEPITIVTPQGTTINIIEVE